ncbi:MAG: glycoside hydrolase family 140 protein [Bacteroidota bacterium]
MRQIVCLVIFFTFCSNLHAQSIFKKGRLLVSKDGRNLQFSDGTAFFWLGDTGWELFHRLKLEEIEQYLDNRAAKGFNVIQAVALAEFDGLRKPNQYGELPLLNLDPSMPNSKYFKVIDSTVHMAARRNLFIGLLPTWGDKVTKLWGEGPVVFDSVNAFNYGKWIGQRYKNDPNIIWILGGDRPAVNDENDWRPVWRAMAKGIKAATNNNCLITYHPAGGNNSTSQWLNNEPWLDINMFQSGHGGGHDVASWDLVKRDLAYSPARPTLDAEPNYEDHPVSPWPKWNVDNGYFRDYDVRKQTYRSVFAGACGVTYGHHAVWQFMNAKEAAINYPDRGWINALDRPGAFQVGYLKSLLLSRPMFQRIADSSIIVSGQGEKGEHIESFHTADYSYTMIYLPVGKTFAVNTRSMPDLLKVWWFNPKDASTHEPLTIKRNDRMEFTPPTTGFENDWVLVLDDASRNFKRPGIK